jgi:signal transduction histidine kinase
MRWFRGALRQACRHGWGATAGLALVTLLIHLVINNYLNKTFDTRSAPWCLIPVFAGILILNGRQEGLLTFFFLSLEVSYTINHRRAPFDFETGFLFARRIVILLACIWSAHILSRLKEQRIELQHSEALLTQKLTQSLKASALAHELRQPLSQLLLQTRLMQHRFEQQGSISPPLELAMAEVQTSGRQINQLIEAIGSLLNESTTPSQPLDLAMVVRTCLQRLQPQLQAAAVELQHNALEQPWLVHGHTTQLQIACCNLISNGLEALQGQPSPRQLAIALRADGDQVELQVADSGPGLPSTQLRDLVLASSKANGMGVGLLTVQSIASRHGGTLQLGRSERLGGAELRLRLPLAETHPN